MTWDTIKRYKLNWSNLAIVQGIILHRSPPTNLILRTTLPCWDYIWSFFKWDCTYHYVNVYLVVLSMSLWCSSRVLNRVLNRPTRQQAWIFSFLQMWDFQHSDAACYSNVSFRGRCQIEIFSFLDGPRPFSRRLVHSYKEHLQDKNIEYGTILPSLGFASARTYFSQLNCIIFYFLVLEMLLTRPDETSILFFKTTRFIPKKKRPRFQRYVMLINRFIQIKGKLVSNKPFFVISGYWLLIAVICSHHSNLLLDPLSVIP